MQCCACCRGRRVRRSCPPCDVRNSRLLPMRTSTARNSRGTVVVRTANLGELTPRLGSGAIVSRVIDSARSVRTRGSALSRRARSSYIQALP